MKFGLTILAKPLASEAKNMFTYISKMPYKQYFSVDGLSGLKRSPWNLKPLKINNLKFCITIEIYFYF